MENELISRVKLEKERADSKNAVEEYVYALREKLDDEYNNYVSDSDREHLSSLLNSTENWLYEEGEDESKSTYIDKLAELKVRWR